jgi:transcriptional regulator GlxA family with amidase domain
MTPSTGCLTPEDAVRIVREEKRVDRRVSAALELIDSNLHERISITELARAVNLSRWRFCHLFKRETSLSPSVYIGTLRILEAEKMLVETFLSVKEIRAKLGNLDRTHFSRAFKKCRGLTPAQFRRRLVDDIHKTTTHYAAT